MFPWFCTVNHIDHLLRSQNGPIWCCDRWKSNAQHQWARKSGYVSIRNMAAELPLMLDVLTDDWENDFFEKKVDDNFMFSCCSIHIFKVKSKSNNPWIFWTNDTKVFSSLHADVLRLVTRSSPRGKEHVTSLRTVGNLVPRVHSLLTLVRERTLRTRLLRGPRILWMN